MGSPASRSGRVGLDIMMGLDWMDKRVDVICLFLFSVLLVSRQCVSDDWGLDTLIPAGSIDWVLGVCLSFPFGGEQSFMFFCVEEFVYRWMDGLLGTDCLMMDDIDFWYYTLMFAFQVCWYVGCLGLCSWMLNTGGDTAMVIHSRHEDRCKHSVYTSLLLYDAFVGIAKIKSWVSHPVQNLPSTLFLSPTSTVQPQTHALLLLYAFAGASVTLPASTSLVGSSLCAPVSS